eukprot:TRINITY_DN10836_c0_g1_i1.p1 TRINITY_DN10836_c0_g1~~TRINITY_DN10836_c0_g1_i1.p1  ORF type:complete len:192 (-),score=37.34 TRINITY_DN10836_c0_g1_i1:97-618(-)
MCIRDSLRKYLIDQAEKRPWRHDPQSKTDQSQVDQTEQLIKSVIFQRYYKEIPFSIGVKLEEIIFLSDSTVKISCILDVQTKIQRGMVIGYKGRNIKYLKDNCLAILMKEFQKPVEINFRVVVRDEPIWEANAKTEFIAPEDKASNMAQKEIDDYFKGGRGNVELLQKLQKRT